MATPSGTILTLTTPASLSDPNGGTCNLSGSQENSLFLIFNQLATDCNSILLSRLGQQVVNAKWSAIAQEIATLVAIANTPGQSADQRSLIYGRIMLMITAQYLPAVSEFLGEQISEQAAIQNMSSDISAFIIEAENGFNTLGSEPDCVCTETCDDSTTSGGCTNSCSTTTDCLSNYNFYSGVMSLIAGIDSVNAPDSGPDYSFNFTATVQIGNTVIANSSEINIIAFLTDTTIWGSSTPLSSSEASQINTALLNIATTMNPSTETDNIPANAWSEMNLSGMASAICSWTQPYGSADSSGEITTNNAPLVYTEPATIQADLNTAAQTVEGVATSTQTIENFQVQEIDQYYGITNSIQMSQEQQCSAMVKQQTA